MIHSHLVSGPVVPIYRSTTFNGGTWLVYCTNSPVIFAYAEALRIREAEDFFLAEVLPIDALLAPCGLPC